MSSLCLDWPGQALGLTSSILGKLPSEIHYNDYSVITLWAERDVIGKLMNDDLWEKINGSL